MYCAMLGSIKKKKNINLDWGWEPASLIFLEAKIVGYYTSDKDAKREKRERQQE